MTHLSKVRPGLALRQLGILAALMTAACAAPQPEPAAIRLADLFASAAVEGSPQAAAEEPPTEWRFDGEVAKSADGTPARGFQSALGATDLVVRQGLLMGRTTSDLPIVHVERTSGPWDEDILDTVEVRLRVSRGSELAVTFAGAEAPDFNPEEFERYIRGLPLRTWVARSPLESDGQMHTYVMHPKGRWAIPAAYLRHLVLRPTNVADAEFAIESVRLIFRRERLASIPSGLGWHGLGEIYRETVVARVPETIRYRLKLPSRPRLELALGTLDPTPVTFRVGVGESGREGTVALERTVTTPHRWENLTVDLSAYGGQEVDLVLELAAEQPATLGLWGSPVIRNGLRTAAAEARPQGVIVVITDTLRADHLDAYGYERRTAPAVSRMAAAGARFENCIAQAPWTKPSVPSIFTSLDPLSHGVLHFADRLPAAATTLAEVFREAGFATLALSSIHYAGQFSGVHQGFEVMHEAGSLTDQASAKTAREYVDRLLPWLETHRDLPFFVVLHVLDAHHPLEPRAPWDTLWASAERQEEHHRQKAAVVDFIENPLMKVLGMPSRAELEKAGIDPDHYISVDVDWYDGSIRGLDAELGRLAEILRQLGLEERTLIALIADHGEEYLEHGRSMHGHTVYGELTRVPLILQGPGVAPGTAVSSLVRTIDLMPTLLELSGLPVPEKIHGQSLVPLLEPQAEGRWRERPAFTARVYPERQTQLMDTESYAVVFEGWKLVKIRHRDAPEPVYELYDARTDPLDLDNVADQHPQRVERLAGMLEDWHREAIAQQLPSDDELTQELDAEELARLRSLGYIR